MRSPLFVMLMVVGSIRADGADAPILFVHGNGDSAALWHTTIWRFESNGYDPAMLFAMDMPHPSARANDAVPEVNRSSTHDQLTSLSREVDRILSSTGADELVLIGSSRGGNAIRNYIRNGDGDDKVSIAILCGTPNHGVVARAENPDAEFNGMGRFLTSLNEGSEVYPGVDFFTIRSDTNDKYAQPTGEFLGFPGVPTGVSYDGPELEGATNIVIPRLDHREVAFHPEAFRELYRAVTAREPETLEFEADASPILDGIVSDFENDVATNLPVNGARLKIYEVDPKTGIRKGSPVHDVTTGNDGRWGPFTASSSGFYELVVTADDYPTLHYYRSPFLRSSRYVNLRLAPLAEFLDEEGCVGSAVHMTRPRGYFGHGRDRFTIDGDVPEGINEGVPGTSAATRCFDKIGRSVAVVFNEEIIVVRTFPVAKEHIAIAEFHY